jgi:flagellar motor component MotA
MIVQAIITKRQDDRKFSHEKEEKLLNAVIDGNKKISEIAEILEKKIVTINEKLEKHIRIESAIDEAIIASLKGNNAEKEIDRAEELLCLREEKFVFKMNDIKYKRQGD